MTVLYLEIMTAVTTKKKRKTMARVKAMENMKKAIIVIILIPPNWWKVESIQITAMRNQKMIKAVKKKARTKIMRITMEIMETKMMTVKEEILPVIRRGK